MAEAKLDVQGRLAVPLLGAILDNARGPVPPCDSYYMQGSKSKPRGAMRSTSCSAAPVRVLLFRRSRAILYRAPDFFGQ